MSEAATLEWRIGVPVILRALRRIALVAMDGRGPEEALAQLVSDACDMLEADSALLIVESEQKAGLEIIAGAGADSVGVRLLRGISDLGAMPIEAWRSVRPGRVAVSFSDEGRECALIVARRPEQPFQDDDRAVLESIAAFIPLLLHQLRLDSSLKSYERHLELLQSAPTTVGPDTNFSEIFDRIVASIHRQFPRSNTALFLLNEARTHLLIAADDGLYADRPDLQLSPEAPDLARALAAGPGTHVVAFTTPEACQDLGLGPEWRSAILAAVIGGW